MLSSLTEVEPRIADVLRRRITPSADAPRNRASNAGDECERRLVYRRTHGAAARLHDITLQSIYDVGHETESAVVRLLEEAGVPLLERERPLEWPELQLAGHIDGRIEADGQRHIIDIKSMSAHIYDSITSVEDMLSSRRPWVRAYPVQM